MPKALSDLVSVDAVKTELRIGSDVEDHDPMIEQHMESALALVQGYARVPIIDTKVCLVCYVDSTNKPLRLANMQNVLSVDSVSYYPSEAEWMAGTPGTVTDYGRIIKSKQARVPHNLLLFPPAEGWPAAVRYEVVLNLGLDADKDKQAIEVFKRAIVATAKYFYAEQPQQINIDEKITRLIGPYARIVV